MFSYLLIVAYCDQHPYLRPPGLSKIINRLINPACLWGLGVSAFDLERQAVGVALVATLALLGLGSHKGCPYRIFMIYK